MLNTRRDLSTRERIKFADEFTTNFKDKNKTNKNIFVLGSHKKRNKRKNNDIFYTYRCDKVKYDFATFRIYTLIRLNYIEKNFLQKEESDTNFNKLLLLK